MKLTTKQLKQIIAEELRSIMEFEAIKTGGAEETQQQGAEEFDWWADFLSHDIKLMRTPNDERLLFSMKHLPGQMDTVHSEEAKRLAAFVYAMYKGQVDDTFIELGQSGKEGLIQAFELADSMGAIPDWQTLQGLNK